MRVAAVVVGLATVAAMAVVVVERQDRMIGVERDNR